MKGSYTSVGWSNRLGSVITPAAIPGVYTACRPFYWNTIDVGCRMTIIELKSSSSTGKPNLLIHSPVFLDQPLQNAINKLGTVKHVISPNYEHVKYAKMWSEIYKDAYMWCCPGLMEKEPDVRWTGELPFGCRPLNFHNNEEQQPFKDIMWDWSEVQPFHIDVEALPLTNQPFFNEVVFFHTASKTLLTTDTYWNYPKDGITNSNYDALKEKMLNESNNNEKEEDFGVWELAPLVDEVPLTSRLWKVGMDKLFKPFYLNLMIEEDKQMKFKEMCNFISGFAKTNTEESCWDVETIIPAHGDIVRGGTFAKAVLKEHFNL